MMIRRQELIWSFSVLILMCAFWIASSVYADQTPGFDLKKVKQLTGNEKKSKPDVEKLFGKTDSKAPVKITEEGCIELWIYTKVIMEGFIPVKTELLYVGFDEKGFVCSAEIEEVTH